jgi:hypothetical protein
MMRAFYFANPGQLVDQGRRVVGDLAVDPGKYVVFAKADIGTNVASGYPPPASSNGGGTLTLKFAGITDVAYAALKPESGDNIETVSLMLAAETEGPGHARLEFLNPYPLRIAVNSIRIAALQIDELTITGESSEDVSDEEQASNLVRYGLAEATSSVSIAKLLHPDDG